MRWIGVAVLLAAVSSPRAADACSIFDGVYDRQVVPGDGSANVPVNAEIRVIYDVGYDEAAGIPFDGAVAVRRVGGDVVEVDVEQVVTDSRMAYVLRPRAELVPNAMYEVLDRVVLPCEGLLCLEDEAQVVAAFSTGNATDDVAPVFGGIAAFDSAVVEADDSDSCGPYEAVLLTLGWEAAADVGDEGWVRYNVYSGGGTLELAYVDRLDAAGEVPCDGWHPRLGEFRGRGGEYFVRAVDVAGNEDDSDVRWGAEMCGGGGGGGCGVGGVSGGAWLVLLALVAVRRRH